MKEKDSKLIECSFKENPFIEANNFIGYSVLGIYGKKDNNLHSLITPPLKGTEDIENCGLLRTIPTPMIVSHVETETILPIQEVILKTKVSQINHFINNLPILIDMEGVYIDYSPGQRTTMAKKIGILTIPALVIPTKVEAVVAYTMEDYGELMKRQEEGLWTGNFQKTENRLNNFFAIANVDGYVGRWVFAKDMKQAKRVYFSLQEEE